MTIRLYNFFRKEVIINFFRKEEKTMNENRVRKAAASVLALAMAASLTAVLAGANDYPDNPHYPEAPSGSYSAPKNKIKETKAEDESEAVEEQNEETEASILTADTVKDALENADSGEVAIGLAEDDKGNVTLMEDTIAAIAKSGTEVTIVVSPKSENEIAYSVSIDPNMINDINGSLNIGMDVIKLEKKSLVSGVKVPADAVVIKTKAKGDFGATLKVTVPKSAFSKMNAAQVRPYAISGKGENKKVVQLPDDAYVINADGSVTILIDDGNAIIVFSDTDIANAGK